jgi:hypothetical protein
VSPFSTAPGIVQKRSQIDSPRPSSRAAPSIWYDAVAAPKRKFAPKAPSPTAAEVAVAVIPSPPRP